MHLNCHTYFSLKYGTISPREFLRITEEKGVKKFAITDINNTSACLDILRLTAKSDVDPVLGIDFRNGADQLFVAIAKNNEGFQEVNEYLSTFMHSGKKIPPQAPAFKHAFVIYPYGKAEYENLRENEYVGLHHSLFNRMRFSKWKDRQDKLVILETVSFRGKRDFNAHRLLRAIDNNVLLSALPKTEEARPNEYLLSEEHLEELYQDYPQIIANSKWLLGQCSIHFEFGSEYGHKNQKNYTGNAELDYRLMRKLVYDGLAYRYDDVTEEILVRIEKELSTIKAKGFVSYFLIAWRILKYAREKEYFYVGR